MLSVAIFDVMMTPGQSSPFILLQPRPTLHTLFPGPQFSEELSLLKGRTYVGIVADSLFAMSHTNFPLVDVDYHFSPSRPIRQGAPDSSKDLDLLLMERECTAYGCLVGTRASRGDSTSSRFERLIEAKRPKLLIDGPAAGGLTDPPLSLPGNRPPSRWGGYGMQGIVLVFCALVGYSFLSSRRHAPSAETSLQVEAEMVFSQAGVAPTRVAEETKEVNPKPAVAFVDPPPKIATDEGVGDHSDGEGDGDGEGEDLRRRRRRRRGKKKSKGDPNGIPTATDEPPNVTVAEPMDVNPNPTQRQSSEKEDYVVVPVPAPEITVPPTALKPLPEPQNSSLTVSDVVLGQFPRNPTPQFTLTSLFPGTRIWVIGYSGLQRLLPGSFGCCKASVARFCNRGISRGRSIARI